MIFQNWVHQRCWGTWKNNQIWHKFGEKWRKSMFKFPSTHYPKIGYWVPIPPLLLIILLLLLVLALLKGLCYVIIVAACKLQYPRPHLNFGKYTQSLIISNFFRFQSQRPSWPQTNFKLENELCIGTLTYWRKTPWTQQNDKFG